MEYGCFDIAPNSDKDRNSKINHKTVMLQILQSLVFIRPFISSLAFPYLNLLYFSLLLIFLIVWFSRRGTHLEIFRVSWMPLVLLFSALIISILFSLDKLNSLKKSIIYVIYIASFLVAASLTYEEKIQIIQTIVFAGFIISLLSIYQYFFGFQHILAYMKKENITNAFALDYINRRRIFFPFVTPNTLAGYLIMIIPLAARNKAWFIVPISLVLLLTKSLGALFSLSLMLLIYFLLRRKFQKKEFMLFLVLLIIFGTLFVTRHIGQKQHTQPFFSTVMRLNYWKDTLEIIKARPLTGVGVGNFNLVYSRYAHNSYLQIWAEMGILGLISIGWLIINILGHLVKNIGIPSSNNKLIPILFLANTVFLIHNFIDFTFFLPEVCLIWWLIFGLASNSI